MSSEESAADSAIEANSSPPAKPGIVTCLLCGGKQIYPGPRFRPEEYICSKVQERFRLCTLNFVNLDLKVTDHSFNQHSQEFSE